MTTSAQRSPALPVSRGELSAGILGYLRGETGRLPDEDAVGRAAPYGDDLQLALYIGYELHYRGFDGVSDAHEWDPALIALRALLENRFLEALRRDATRDHDVDDAFDELLVEPVHGTGVSHFLQDEGELWQLREYAVQRSLYHLKEADPHAWVLPRLWGRAKAGMAAVEFDEWGGGRAERVHAQLFADLMEDLGLETAYGRYVDAGSAEMLATVNLMSLLGLRRGLRGALLGHFATLEVTSSPSSRRMALAMQRAGAGSAAEFFYTEHVEADAVHEQVVRHEVIGGLLEQEPELAADVVFGVDATVFLEDRFADHLLGHWKARNSSLRSPLPQ
ncbi:iron-containing redox enzyme family protein [Streptomyces sp. NBC_00083]|uniref:iron-containing redox enzyme family protein n=1 Tax=Streptomyces sp. NBC_00083 TaxID=2975647 RepID=UPI002257FF47|nr:iron-containing redox enzyme family protein [Streptomyces sp. NBC_00083]MCX5384331.1 iron-containing redox enzyme family protein [Streptomyces sp. NBC_00083]